MGEHRTVVGRLDQRGILPILELSWYEQWTGELNLRNESTSVRCWIVKGEIVHAELRGGHRVAGQKALEQAALWTSGEYILTSGMLPPERSVRIPTRLLLDRLRETRTGGSEQSTESRPTAVIGRTLLEILDGLRERVPGLEGLSIMRGQVIEASALNDPSEMDWMSRQLKSYFSGDNRPGDVFLVEEGRHSFLLLKQGGISTIVSARTGTAPEALFWAGTEAQRRLSSPADKRRPAR